MTPYTPWESLPALLAHRAETQGGQVAVTVDGEAYTYADLWSRSGRVLTWLQGRGVVKGTHVAMLMANSIGFLDTWFALSRAGAVAVPVNTSMIGDALRHTLEHSDSVGLVADAALLPNVQALTDLALPWTVSHGGDVEGATPFEELLSGPDAPTPVEVAGADPMNIIYTSGTTGLPKGVVLSHTSYVNTGGYFAHHLGLRPDDVLHTCLPLFHCNAQQTTLMSGLHLGARVALDGRFSVSRYWPRVAEAGATVSNLLGSMLALLSKREPDEVERTNPLRYVVAAPVPETLHAPLEERFGVRIVEGYGMTETGTMACINPPDDRRPGTIGRPLEHDELRVVDEDGNDLPDGERGELLVRSTIPHAFMDGYYKQPDKTAEAVVDGWLHTGDAVVRRPDGYYVFVDRIKDTIRRRGENISSFLVEKAVADHPEVLEVAALGVASELTEQDVAVVVVRRPESTLTEEQLSDWVGPRISDFMRPRYIRFADSLPRTETGRVQKVLLRGRGAEGSWDREAAGRLTATGSGR